MRVGARVLEGARARHAPCSPDSGVRLMGVFSEYCEAEHRVLDRLLHSTDAEGLDAFRRRLLRRVAIEEQIFLPALVAKLGHPPLYRGALTHDHAGLVALCAPTPQQGEWVEALWEQIQLHHSIEMADEGFCAQCDALLTADAATLLARADAMPEIELPPDGEVRARIQELLARVGLPSHKVAPPPHKPALQRVPPKRRH
jgi:hypothetical protein